MPTATKFCDIQTAQRIRDVIDRTWVKQPKGTNQTERRLTLPMLAMTVGMSTTVLVEWLNGTRAISMAKFEAILEALDICP